MPLIKHINIDNKSDIFVWKISESLNYFRQKLNLSRQDIEEIPSPTDKRKLEWLVVRYLLRLIIGADAEQYKKDEFGKPHLINSDLEISISHSESYFALLISNKNCGIDIQKYTPKITRIAHKFMSESELNLGANLDQMDYLHYLWSAKEAVYKAYGRKNLRFIEHILIDKDKSAGEVQKEQLLHRYFVCDLSTNLYSLVYAIEEME